MFIPIHTKVEATIEDANNRSTQEWEQHKGKHWVKVTDVGSGIIIGPAEWAITKQLASASDSSQPIIADWHIDGSVEKDLAGQYLTGMRSFVNERITRPHIELEQIVVHPDHRQKGIRKILVDWGHRKADELNVECFVVSVPFAVPVHEKIGYGNGGWILPKLYAPPNPSENS
ncbi:hypothetical protein GQ53DRAFT_827414 [Thozetella sp. PMI_491]|nr:hypothetical protein GQ53DRAFT_827414 [Thozetella sp. PMI_491]